jgi:hypothetical protein
VRRLAIALTSLPVLALLVYGGALLLGVGRTSHPASRADVAACAETSRDGEAARERAGDERRPTAPAAALFAGPADTPGADCGRPGGHPERFAELAKANSSRISRTVAPGTRIRPGAYTAAIAQRSAIASAGPAPIGSAAWSPFGDTPLIGNRAEYDQTNGSTANGFVGLSGRATSFTRDNAGRLYAAISNGGVWERDPTDTAWRPISDSLPSQVVSGVAWSSVGGVRGTLLVLTGDNAYGGDTYAGIGGFRTTDGGAHWSKASGLPEGVLGFKMVVDPSDPQKIYAATGGGLFRSTDTGATFVNVDLPTGAGATGATPDCTGKPVTVPNCFLANMVTDVVVQGPANGKGLSTPGAVMAAVGWRAGTKRNVDGAEQSHGNGLYTSPTGAPGSFTNVDLGKSTDNVGATDPIDTQARIGRVALGIANGAGQDHRVVYAVVQDAVKFNGGFTGLDVKETGGSKAAATSEFLNGVWVSTDFGRNWHQLEGASTIDSDRSSGSALAPPACKASDATSFCPGVQAWYNLWIAPDPTRATAAGVPTRLAFGLEEVWNGDRPAGFDGGATTKFTVIGKYDAGSTCTVMTATKKLPECPSQPAQPKTTTHPDQHGALFIPDGQGGVTLLVANDGGVYRQHKAAGESFDNDSWGDGDNLGLHTLQPYDAEMAKDGTAYMGLQDNGEGKVDPDGKSYTIYGGDGFFTAVDPDHSDIAYEEYTGGDISVTKDGGKTWKSIKPTHLTGGLFAAPLQMDPFDADHLMLGGRELEETTAGPATTSDGWAGVFDLGTQQHPGDASAAISADDPANQLSALDLRTLPGGAARGPTGPPTAGFTYTGGTGTVPLGPDVPGGAFPPGTTADHAFTIKPGDGDATADIKITWAGASADWDLYVYRNDGGTLTQVGASAQRSTTGEEVVLPDPPTGDYVVRVANVAATGAYDANVSFAPRSAGSPAQSAAYAGYCGYCDTITQGTPFANGIATNVGGDKPGAAGAPDGWHVAAAQGLPARYITSVQMDPADPRTVFVTLAGYGRRWAFPGAVGEDTSKVGTGHVFKSTDAGATFSDISGNLPDTPANWTVVHDGRLVVGTDIGVFLSDNRGGGTYSVLGTGLPTTPISTLRLKPGDPDLLVAATYGRGIYTYRFPTRAPGAITPVATTTTPTP